MPIFELNRLISYDDESLLAELRRVAALVKSPHLTKSAFNKHSKVHPTCISQRFGGWQQSLARAGLENRYCGPKQKGIISRTFTNEQLLAELRTVSAKVGAKSLTVDLFKQHSAFGVQTMRRRFGSWGAALKEAGISIAKRQRRHSDDDYFENLLAVWTHYGRQPKYREMDEPPSAISSGAYEAKWGTWVKSLQTFIERVNSDTRQEASDARQEVPYTTGVEDIPQPTTGNLPSQNSKDRPPKQKRKEEDQRKIRLGLRYTIQLRDRFRCVLCGANPPANPGCVLHVDHILPWSKGGKTVAANLRTLCEWCNLGKGAKFESEQPTRIESINTD